MTETVLNYPAWLRIDHWLNVLFLTLLLRSGSSRPVTTTV
jgi:methionine sulfoxide reductase catalytic subunit